MGQTHDMPFDIMDVAGLLQIRIRRPSGRGYYADCPFCEDKRGKLHLNTEFDGWKCNYCGEHGGLLDLYGKMKRICNTLTVILFSRNMRTAPLYKGCRKASGDCAPKRRKKRSASGVKVHAGKNGLSVFSKIIYWRWNGEAYCKLVWRQGLFDHAHSHGRGGPAD